MTITIQEALPIMKFKPLTTQEVLDHPKKEYNEQVWVDKINTMSAKYSDIQFYERVESPNEYHELFAVYTIDEGIRLINEVSYGGSLVSSGFSKIDIVDGNVTCESPFLEGGRVANNPKGREWMSTMSQKFGYIFSNKLPLSKTRDKVIEF